MPTMAEWEYVPRLQLMLPLTVHSSETDEQQHALSYFPTPEALQVCSVPDLAKLKHLLGFASWLSSGARAASHDDWSPLLVLRELHENMGTRIWAASWIHRKWALSNSDRFPRGAMVLEMGSGCGLVGLSVAAAHGVNVILSDFRGDGERGIANTVLDNLAFNASSNAAAVAKGGGSVEVIELDWAAPDAPLRWTSGRSPSRTLDLSSPSTSPPPSRPPANTQGACCPSMSAKTACNLEESSSEVTCVAENQSTFLEAFPKVPIQVILATETLYTPTGTRLFVNALAAWLAAPEGVCYLVNNARRTSLGALEALCAEHGLRVQRGPNLEGCGDAEISASFAPPWDDIDLFEFLEIRWAQDKL